MDRAEITLSASDIRLGTGENIAFNEAFLSEIGHLFDLIVVGGDMSRVDIVNQINVLLDNDLYDDDAGSATAAMPLGGDNLLMNRAVLKSEAADTYAELQGTFAEAVDDLQSGMTSLSREVVEDARFVAQEALRALYIDGDFTITNVIDQRTYLGDQDQVHLARDAVAARSGAPLTVTTGANALLNAATITDHGVDSLIMARGSVYSDAMLHQSGLVDSDAQPTGVQLPALVNEAVAFLADDLIAPAAPALSEAPSSSDGWSAPVDLMQTMLA